MLKSKSKLYTWGGHENKFVLYYIIHTCMQQIKSNST